jgi:hypothetical protein
MSEPHVPHGLLGTLTTWWKRLPMLEWMATVALLALGGVLVGHVLQAMATPYARALEAIDATLVPQWPTLPTPAQEALRATYGRLGLVPPSQRQ